MSKLQVFCHSWVMSLSVLGGFLPSMGFAECFDELRSEIQAARFETLANGAVVHDRWTGLIWSRCLLGEVWNQASNICEGDASKLNWSDALAAAANTELAGQADWRAANVKELESIVDRACESPALNTAVFSGFTDNVNAAQWSSTQVESYALGAWTVNFKNGSVIPLEKETLLSIRIVREP